MRNIDVHYLPVGASVNKSTVIDLSKERNLPVMENWHIGCITMTTLQISVHYLAQKRTSCRAGCQNVSRILAHKLCCADSGKSIISKLHMARFTARPARLKCKETKRLVLKIIGSTQGAQCHTPKPFS